MIIGNPNYAPTVNQFDPITVSVSSSASAELAAGRAGPFRGILCIASSSLTIMGINDKPLILDDVTKNTVLWVQGKYVAALNASAATSTNSDAIFVVYGVK
jgi:hypothetical protein